MKRKKIRARTLLCVILALVITMGSVSVVSAECLAFSLSNLRLSDTLCETSSYGEFTYLPDSCTVKVLLQEKYNGGWRDATGLPYIGAEKTAFRNFSVHLVHQFKLVKGKVYRTKVTLIDTKDSKPSTEIRYGPIF